MSYVAAIVNLNQKKKKKIKEIVLYNEDAKFKILTMSSINLLNFQFIYYWGIKLFLKKRGKNS